MSDYLTAEQYEYARKTGDWESGKVLTHRQALNENQQIVLEWLKSETILTREAPILSVNAFSDKNLLGKLPNKVRKAYKLLDCKQEYEVLAAFAQWGLEQEE
ncbi:MULTISPECIES: hypothetical protein [Enterococcus]|uniref:Uncharacterized protein n=1 Tax=Enterococcus faecium EnGen0026 TaxID=1138917 RepID=A0A829A4J5_ENTFC|nr:hypothetical protein [Enterococcus faecium]EFF38339.1 conserved hypothetical protein [Enterococcus faecium E980]ELB39329.1 hypothetical protein OKA_04872 [Enterococcus faecium EnGen0026]ELB41944.1 hypothetical protein OKA_03132 [Enterococcus faecium EnGen0026]MBX9061215.1 hypothetical protein [Enterococcus faecium]HAQ7249835.1 hypothetical protein [Enterococcus faecium]